MLKNQPEIPRSNGSKIDVNEAESLLPNHHSRPPVRPPIPKGHQHLPWNERLGRFLRLALKSLIKYAKFIGPGMMVSVAYMDPGNYSTAVSAGALYQYKLLFAVLISNLIAAFLQILCVKLGSVTGMDLAQNCRQHLPRWLCIVIYILAEITIIATDLAEVVGAAISLNILLDVPLSIGVSLTVIDVLIVLIFYRPEGSMKMVRYFEWMVSFLVIMVVICFGIELSNIGPVDKGELFKGFFPSKDLLETKGLYLSCGILGATVMPHSLYLGSGLVQPRLREFDIKHGYHSKTDTIEDESDESTNIYKPSIHAINYAMNYSILELVVSLFTVAIFVNSAILIVAGNTLYGTPEAVDADLFSIYNMLQKYLSQTAGTVFALALLFSGQSAGIVCTLSGQMVAEGFIHWAVKPWVRRLITRVLAIAPCFLIALFVGRKGLATVINGSQVVLSVLLPFVSAPLIYFTCKKSIMRVPIVAQSSSYQAVNFSADPAQPVEYKDMSNSKLTNITAIVLFSIVSSLNVFMMISMAMGADIHF